MSRDGGARIAGCSSPHVSSPSSQPGPDGSELQIPQAHSQCRGHSDGREASRGGPHPGIPTETLSGRGIPASWWQNLGLDLDAVAAGARLTQTSREQMWGGVAQRGQAGGGSGSRLLCWGQNTGAPRPGQPALSAPGGGAQGSPKTEDGGGGLGELLGCPLSPAARPGTEGAWSPGELQPGQASAWRQSMVRPRLEASHPHQGSLSWAQSLWARGFHSFSRTDEVWLWTISAATAKRPDPLTLVPPAVHQDLSFREDWAVW